MIEDGKLTYPVKGATLSATVRRSMKAVDDRQRSRAGWRHGRAARTARSVPVGVGQPTLRIDGLTVGGTYA